MRIAINTRFLLKGKLEGIGRFTYEIVKRMVLNHPETDFIFVFDRPYSEEFIFAKNITPIIVSPPARHPILFYLWFEWALPFKLRKYKPDVFISTDGFNSLSLKIPTITVIHDLAPVHFPEHVNKSNRYYFNYFVPKFIKNSQKIVAVSQATKDDIIDTFGTAADKIDVIYNASNMEQNTIEKFNQQETKDKYSSGEEYLLYVGAIHPRKNVATIIKAFNVFKVQTKAKTKLVLVGRFAWKNEEVNHYINISPYKKDIILFGHLPHDELVSLYSSALAFIYISLFEGFGIPLLEAMQHNTPVITSNISSMPEVVGDAALLADPKNINDVAEKIIILYQDKTLRNELIEKGKLRLKFFDWNVSSEKMYKLLTDLS